MNRDLRISGLLGLSGRFGKTLTADRIFGKVFGRLPPLTWAVAFLECVVYAFGATLVFAGA
jgi:hypothetical protein